MNSLKLRLIVMNFLEFAVWGAYLTCMGNYLGAVGLGDNIPLFYAIQGIVSIFMPTIMGIVSDKWIQPQRLLGLCHLVAGCMMLAIHYISSLSDTPDASLHIIIYTISVAFYMPTLSLSNTAAFTILKSNNLDTVKAFPPIRVFGTIGFIATMWFVNCAALEDDGDFLFTFAEHADKFQYTFNQFGVSGVLSIILFLYCFTLPQCPVVKSQSKSLAESFGLNAFKLFKSKQMAMFFIFSALLGMSLQITNGYANPYITSFKGIPEMADTFGANNATMLISLSQIAEALCILLIPFFLKRFGIKIVMLIAMVAWVFRFGFFGLGNPAFPGVILFILSCLVYGVAFDFFNVSGGLYVDKVCKPEVRASAQGLFMLMTNGIGSTVGTLLAGEVIEHFCEWKDGYLLGDWTSAWLIFATYALIVAVAFAIIFKNPKPEEINR